MRLRKGSASVDEARGEVESALKYWRPLAADRLRAQRAWQQATAKYEDAVDALIRATLEARHDGHHMTAVIQATDELAAAAERANAASESADRALEKLQALSAVHAGTRAAAR